jgi:hypothetical protein
VRYRVLAPMTLYPGAVLGLTPEQADARSFGLDPKGGFWLVTKAVSFKAGEQIEHEGDLPKSLAHVVEPAEQVEPADKPAETHAAPRKTIKRGR